MSSITLVDSPNVSLTKMHYESLWLDSSNLFGNQRPLRSIVPGHRGKCRPVQLNQSTIVRQQAGGVTGTFVRVRALFGFVLWDMGREFYGIIRDGSKVVEHTTFRGDAQTWEERFEANSREWFRNNP